jgi:hypothetical protein
MSRHRFCLNFIIGNGYSPFTALGHPTSKSTFFSH